MKEFTIKPNEAGQRFDKYLAKLLSDASMSFIFKMLRKKNFILNDKKAAGNEILHQGDVVKLFLADETFEKFASKSKADVLFVEYSEFALEKLDLRILYEDTHILAFHKPAGMLSQKAKEDDVSVNEYFIGYLLHTRQISQQDLHTFRPSIANRLDRNTSGLILCGKTLAGLQYLAQIIKDRSLEKYYCCITEGHVKEIIALEGYLTKDTSDNTVKITKQKKDAGAAYIKTGINPISQHRVEAFGTTKYYSELLIHLYTGKTHQIRAHLSSIGHPIVGDFKYGHGKEDALAGKCRIKRQLLHSYRVVFPESEGTFGYLSGKEIVCVPSKDYKRVLEELKNGNVE